MINKKLYPLFVVLAVAATPLWIAYVTISALGFEVCRGLWFSYRAYAVVWKSTTKDTLKNPYILLIGLPFFMVYIPAKTLWHSTIGFASNVSFGITEYLRMLGCLLTGKPYTQKEKKGMNNHEV